MPNTNNDPQVVIAEKQLVFHTKEEIDAAFQAFQKETQTGWRCFGSSSLFGKPIDETIETLKGRSRVHWSVMAVDGISFPFNGIPMMSAGTVHFHCHKGVDIDEKKKEKRRRQLDEQEKRDQKFRKRRAHSSKKIGCPAKVFMSRVIKFPKYKVDEAPDGKRPPERKMRAAAARLKEDLKQGQDTEAIQEFVLKLPDESAHLFHFKEAEGSDAQGYLGGSMIMICKKLPKKPYLNEDNNEGLNTS